MVRSLKNYMGAYNTTACLVGFISLALPAIVYAQKPPVQEVTIRRLSNNVNDPAVIVGFTLDGQSYDLSGHRDSQPIPTSPDWLERLSITVRNVSTKPLAAGTIQLTCPGMGNGHTLNEPRIVDQFTVGVLPTRFRSVSAEDSHKNDPGLSIPSGGEVTFVLGNDFQRLRKKLPASGEPVDCTVHPVRFFFVDGTMWSPLHFYKPDPNSDRGYVDSTHEEFGRSAATE